MHIRTANARRTRRLSLAGAATLTAAVAATAIAFNAAGTGPVAQAATVTYDPLAPALDFNAFVEDVTELHSTESEGAMATGGNLVVRGSYNVNIHEVASFTAPGDARPSALVVGGRVDYDQDPATSVVQVHDYVKVGDLTGTTVRNTDGNNASVNTRLVASGSGYDSTPRIELNVQQPLASVGPTSPIDFDSAFAQLRENSANLYVCDAYKVPMNDRDRPVVVPKGGVQSGQGIRISLKPGVTNILEVTGEDLNDMADLTFDTPPTADTPLLINVDTSGTGNEFDWDVASQAGISGTQAPYILWNFPDTTRLNIASGDTVEGSILAPNADYRNVSPTNVEGQIIAKNAKFGDLGENGGEIHHFPFAAEFSCEDETPTESPSDTTDAPTSDEETTPCETTDAPSSEAPTTEEPTTDGPTTDEPTTDGPTTDGPTTDQPTSDAPTSDAPSSEAPSSGGPTTGGPATTADGDCAPLATTGSSTTGPLLIAAGTLVAVGAGVVAVASIRRRSTKNS
ncbi:choice-of-anchor A domain-containing protein [Glycomyces sambucus]|uniref:Choice-of-anchor A domain-containing protein n=1 Tax=Glycomyces sambucus TaxID=380244 RepID=A0A1G9M8A2_9ACTN|nr:choice-of-anchor A family protein [Glycomyces sambucus]SDL70500.1 choice-of-anchor A domain-containing protein [Glycomyces sambucus]